MARRKRASEQALAAVRKARKTDLVRMYRTMTVYEIADCYGVSYSMMRRRMADLDIPLLGKPGRTVVFRKAGKSTLERMYWRQDTALSDIAERYGVTTTTVRTRFDELGIPKRSTSERAAFGH